MILSIDLAYKSYKDFGFCLLEESAGEVLDVEYLSHKAVGLGGTPDAEAFAQNTLNFCLHQGISILMLDGPQGWKAPDNGLAHQRVCEKYLNTQAKTGTKGKVKPRNFTSFISFAVDIFRLFDDSNQVSLVMEPEVTTPAKGILLVETYPYSAWWSLNIQPLPGKKKCTTGRLAFNTEELKRRFDLPKTESPTHDELSALVAGLAGVAIAAGNTSGYIAVGIPPKLVPEGYLVEGYIVNPRQPGEKKE